MNVYLEVDEAFDELLKGLDEDSKAVQKAIRRAVRKLTQFLRRQLLQALSQTTGLKQKAFKNNQRLFIEVAKDGKSGRVWLGLNPIGLHHFGNPKQVNAGVKVRGKPLRQGAFTIQSSHGNTVVFKRKGKARFPIEYQTEAIDQLATPVVERIIKQAEERFFTLLEQELNYALNHE
ncbi:phage tail protein [Spartinivicinus ruber]|uniref:phage tail protein n=1 Tax=Spartinivicinus ruber TaxID=2683272 RepID=UPI0013D302E5|nr:phage tail protein [Spartinivicinus ruber]